MPARGHNSCIALIMKKILVMAVIVFGNIFFAIAQPQVNVQFNIGTQPAWGPVGYDYAEYYYLPDIETYYIVDRHEYVYYDQGRWVTTRALPPRYRNYDLYHGYKVVMNQPKPWINHEHNRAEYAHYMSNRGQGNIRDAREPKYYQNPGHPRHGEWKPEHHDNGLHRGHGKK